MQKITSYPRDNTPNIHGPLGKETNLPDDDTLTFTFTFWEDSMLSSAEAIISFVPMHNPKITERLYKSFEASANLNKVCD